MGGSNVEIVVAETGWPYRGDVGEAGATVENARAYNGNLIKHLRSMVGTPLMPGKSVDTYLFALYDENLKPGPTSERSFGLFKPDLSMTYDVGLSKNSNQVFQLILNSSDFSMIFKVSYRKLFFSRLRRLQLRCLRLQLHREHLQQVLHQRPKQRHGVYQSQG